MPIPERKLFLVAPNFGHKCRTFSELSREIFRALAIPGFARGLRIVCLGALRLERSTTKPELLRTPNSYEHLLVMLHAVQCGE